MTEAEAKADCKSDNDSVIHNDNEYSCDGDRKIRYVFFMNFYYLNTFWLQIVTAGKGNCDW